MGVVVPAFRNAAYLERTLRSLQAQEFQTWTAVVVDDGSPQDDALVARRVASADPRIRVVRQRNSGVSAARNRGAEELGNVPRFLLFLDADDVLLAHALVDLVAVLEKHPTCPAAYGAVAIIDADDRVVGGSVLPARMTHTGLDGRPRSTRSVSMGELALRNPIPCPSAMLIRAMDFTAVGGFDTRFSYAADNELALRLARIDGLRPTHTTVTLYRKHAEGMTSTVNAAGHEEIRRLRAWTYASTANTPDDRRDLRRAWRRHNLMRAREAWSGTGETTTHRRTRLVGHLALAALGRPLNLADRRAGQVVMKPRALKVRRGRTAD